MKTFEVDPTFDLPLLRKAVEWAVEQHEKGLRGEFCEWEQAVWRSNVDYIENGRPVCGTVYCVAGYVCEISGVALYGNAIEDDGRTRNAEGYYINYEDPGDRAQRLLGLTRDEAVRLFDEENTIDEVLETARFIAIQHGQELGL